MCSQNLREVVGSDLTVTVEVADATGPPIHKDHGDVESNANLFAAAPDLLGALEWLVKICDAEQATHIYKKHIDDARAAIKKARGEA